MHKDDPVENSEQLQAYMNKLDVMKERDFVKLSQRLSHHEDLVKLEDLNSGLAEIFLLQQKFGL